VKNKTKVTIKQEQVAATAARNKQHNNSKKNNQNQQNKQNKQVANKKKNKQVNKQQLKRKNNKKQKAKKQTDKNPDRQVRRPIHVSLSSAAVATPWSLFFFTNFDKIAARNNRLTALPANKITQ